MHIQQYIHSKYLGLSFIILGDLTEWLVCEYRSFANAINVTASL